MRNLSNNVVNTSILFMRYVVLQFYCTFGMFSVTFRLDRISTVIDKFEIFDIKVSVFFSVIKSGKRV